MNARILRLSGAFVIAGAGIAGGLALTGGVASAHTGHLQGSATCESDGSYSVAWTLTTTNVPAGDTANVTLKMFMPGAISGLPVTIVGNATQGGITQTNISGQSVSPATLSVHLHWTGSTTYTGTASGSVALGGTCKAPPPATTTTTAPSATTTTTTPATPTTQPTATPPVVSSASTVPTPAVPTTPITVQPTPAQIAAPAQTPASIQTPSNPNVTLGDG